MYTWQNQNARKDRTYNELPMKIHVGSDSVNVFLHGVMEIQVPIQCWRSEVLRACRDPAFPLTT